jgi:DNA repair protein RecN (Recombination protein N)
MLRFLSIRHLAVIDSVQVELHPGFNVLTGETGAGKSILVEAVGLLLGGRASGDLVRTGEEMAIIEAAFESAGDEWVVRREVTAQGRSRAFINGDLTTVGGLKELANRLVELHGQHEHQTLLDPASHLPLIDSAGALEAERTRVAAAFDAWQRAQDDYERLRTLVAERDARYDLASFQLAEIERAAPQAGEDGHLRSLKQVLSSAERIERLCNESYAALYEQDGAVLGTLGHVWRRVGELAQLDPAFGPYLDARDGIKSQLEELALHLRRYADGIEASPDRLQQVEDRLALLERLKRKYGPTLEDVCTRRETLRADLDMLEKGGDALASQERLRDRARASYADCAAALSQRRRASAGALREAIERLLHQLAMESTRFEVRFDDALPEAQWTAQGFDRVEFYLSPNVGEELRPLARIVSGGELSRVMLALKTLSATNRFGFSDRVARPPGLAAPGLIFDEVDSGIGGRVADVVGARLRALGSAFQVLCITHLPQIAGYADSHYLIEKQVTQGRTRTTVRRLDRSGRILELARMLGGATVTAQTCETAAQMLDRRAPDPHDGNPATTAGIQAESSNVEARAHADAPGRAGAKGEANTKGESESGPRTKAKPRPRGL